MKRNWKRAGFDGLYDHRHHRPSPKRVPVKTLDKVLELYRETYSDFNVRHFHEKLREEHGIHYSYTWVKKALQTSGLITVRRIHETPWDFWRILAPRGKLSKTMIFSFTNAKVTRVEVVGDPARLRELDIAVL
jgi:hypothetical protein